MTEPIANVIGPILGRALKHQEAMLDLPAGIIPEEEPMPKSTGFAELDEMALRYTGWRILTDKADRRVKGDIVVTVSASGTWAICREGQQVAIGAGENPIVSAIAALVAAAELSKRPVAEV